MHVVHAVHGKATGKPPVAAHAVHAVQVVHAVHVVHAEHAVHVVHAVHVMHAMHGETSGAPPVAARACRMSSSAVMGAAAAGEAPSCTSKRSAAACGLKGRSRRFESDDGHSVWRAPFSGHPGTCGGALGASDALRVLRRAPSLQRAQRAG